MPERSWNRVEELFHQAAEMDSGQRAAFLQNSVSDPQVRGEVESLLAYERKSATFIEDRALLACELLADCDTPAANHETQSHDASSEATPDPLVGTTMSRFHIVERLGSGGMGLVYRAEDLQLGRQVALKFLKRNECVSEAELSSLEHLYLEARALSALDHPNICTIYEVDQHEGTPFLVMQLLVGRSLKQEIGGGALPVDRVLKFGIECANALEAAHTAGIIHRDIKSANLFVTQRDEIKVLDFGLAQSERSREITARDGYPLSSSVELCNKDNLVRTAEAFGTVAYMSPQQILGEHLDGRTDVFSLGVVLYEMATGQLPFKGENAADILAKILNDASPDAAKMNPAVPVELANVIARCLEKDPRCRYQSAAELRDALINIQSAQLSAGGTGRRNRWSLSVVLAAVACVAVACAAILFFMHRRKASNQPVARRQAVVLADFRNSTAETVFEETLNQALRVQLEQSPHLNVLSPQVIAQEQQYMGMQSGAPVSSGAALKICQRVGGDAMISGSIAAMGSHYVIGLTVVNCQTGARIASEQVEVARREDVLPALGKEVHRVRTKMGESPASVQQFDAPVEEATTPSLQALRAYGVGLKTWYAEGEKSSIPFFLKATELDPRFAMAYARLGNAYFETSQPALAKAAITKAYELREHVSERERFYIESHYYEQVSGELDKAVQVFQLWQDIYPDDPVPYVNLGADYTTLGRHELALEQDRKALQLEPDLGLLYSNLALEYASMEDYEGAANTLRAAEQRKLQYATLAGAEYELAFLRGDQSEMQRQLQRGMNHPWTEAWLLALQADTEAFYGRYAQAKQFTRRAVASAMRYNDAEAAIGYELMGALRDAEYGAKEQAKTTARRVLAADNSQQSQVLGALALARADDTDGALEVARELEKRFPADIMIQEYWLPTIRAAAELSRGEPSAAVQLLLPVESFDLASPKTPTTAALYPVYLRGLAMFQAGQLRQAAAEFQKVLSHEGIAQNYLVLPLASLQIARVYRAIAMQGGSTAAHDRKPGELAAAESQAEAAYHTFLNLWKDADKNLHILGEAQHELHGLRTAHRAVQ